LTGAIAAKDEARVRAVSGMEGAERKGGSAGWCNWVTMLIESSAPGPCIIFKGSLKPANVWQFASNYPLSYLRLSLYWENCSWILHGSFGRKAVEMCMRCTNFRLCISVRKWYLPPPSLEWEVAW
jgi:hypothetical protein